MKDYKVKIEGISPLMHSRYPIDAVQITKKGIRGKVFNPEEQVQKCLYRNSKNEIYQPADHIEGALIRVGSQLRISGGGRKTYKDQMRTNIQIVEQEIPFSNGDKFETDVRLCVIPSTRGRVPVARPRWDKWEFEFTLRVFDETMLSGEVLRELLELAGREQGIGTYRPKFGRFIVKSFELLK